jgi:hypothetical protein
VRGRPSHRADASPPDHQRRDSTWISRASFIGSASEGLDIAHTLQGALSQTVNAANGAALSLLYVDID